ncbi:MAG TPA: hypothetical protein PKA64_22590, partial [Myxococcota bacterium]|nr:hypothetical protein [Myxococcota bacterium]
DAGAPGAHARGVTALEQAYARGRDRDDLWVRWADLVRHGGGAAAPGRAPRTPEERAVAERLEEEDALE